jgi:hypothetical protein
MSEARPPENVRVVIGGREYPCDVLRDPDQDTLGCAAWVAVPRRPLPALAPGETMSVLASVLPAKTALTVRVEQADGLGGLTAGTGGRSDPQRVLGKLP